MNRITKSRAAFIALSAILTGCASFVFGYEQERKRLHLKNLFDRMVITSVVYLDNQRIDPSLAERREFNRNFAVPHLLSLLAEIESSGVEAVIAGAGEEENKDVFLSYVGVAKELRAGLHDVNVNSCPPATKARNR